MEENKFIPELMLDFPDRGGLAEIPAPRLCICLLTYQRTAMTIRTIVGLSDHLIYPRQLTGFYVADDGSSREHIDKVLNHIKICEYQLVGYHNEKFVSGKPFCGIGWNMALQKGHQNADIILWIEDDWELKKELDIRPYVRMLIERQDVGMVRLSGLPTGLDLRVEAHNGIHYLECLRSSKMAYSGNPHLRHVRFSQYYGLFATDRTPGDMEINYDERFRAHSGGPNIWRPADLSAWGIFGHIGNERTW